jgi:hypothetical protein
MQKGKFVEASREQNQAETDKSEIIGHQSEIETKPSALS